MKRPKFFLLFLLLLLTVLQANGMQNRVYQVINASNGLADNSAQIVVCTRSGRMIIATLGNLNFYDGVTFSHISTRNDYQYQLSAYKGNYHLYFDLNHHVWLKDTHKVSCVDMMTEKASFGIPMPLGSQGTAFMSAESFGIPLVISRHD